MTAHSSSDAVSTAESSGSLRQILRLLVLVVGPLGLAGVMWFHPHRGGDALVSLSPVADRWFLVHVVMLPFICLLGVTLYVLLDEYRGAVATVGRIGTLVYIASYVAFEALAGIATGLALRATRPLPAESHDAAATIITAVGENALVAGLALLGTLGCFVATGAIVTLYRRRGAPAVPLALLFGAPLVLVAHGNSWAVLFAALFVVGVAWLELGWRATDG